MNAIQKAQNAYRNGARPAKTPRDTEYDAFARITSQLKASSSMGKKGYNQLAAAVHDNRKLWTILAADVVSTANTLPDDLKARIVSLSEFTRQHSSKILRRQAGVQPLIEINVAVMRGLRQTTPSTAGSSPDQTHTSHKATLERAAAFRGKAVAK